MQLVYKFGLLRNSVEFDESDDNIAIRIKIFNSMLQKVIIPFYDLFGNAELPVYLVIYFGNC